MSMFFEKEKSKAVEVAATFKFEMPEPSQSTNSTPRQPLTPSTPTAPRHDYNDPNTFYVNRDFFGFNEEHISVFVDDELEIIEEGPSWTKVRERESGGTGMIPSDLLESGAERLAQENKSLNQDLLRSLSCNCGNQNETVKRNKKKAKRRVSFAEKDPQVHLIPAGGSQTSLNDSFQFPYLMDEGAQDALGTIEATMFDVENDSHDHLSHEHPLGPTEDFRKGGFLQRLIKGLTATKESRGTGADSSAEGKAILESLQSFPQYEDHLIRVYTGNFDSVLHGFKTFIVEETVPLNHFTSLVVDSFGLAGDGYEYELNLVNHLTAEVIPLNVNFSVSQIIELTKREALAFCAAMPKELRKAQRPALKKMEKLIKSGQMEVETRDKTSDYVTPFKFVLNRVYREGTAAPVWIHVHLAGNPENQGSSLVFSSMTSAINDSTSNSTKKKTKNKKSKGFLSSLFSKKNKSKTDTSTPPIDVVERIRINCDATISTLIGTTLERFGVPSTLPGIYFEASLPAIHDAIELPLSVNMTVGDALRIRPKLDPSQQMVLVRPSIRYSGIY